MQKTLNIFWNGGESMTPCFDLLLLLHVKSLGLFDPKMKLRQKISWLKY
jgi:hypothetical protein